MKLSERMREAWQKEALTRTTHFEWANEVELLEEEIETLKRAATNYLNCADTQMLAAGVHNNIAPSLKKDYDRWYSELDALLADTQER